MHLFRDLEAKNYAPCVVIHMCLSRYGSLTVIVKIVRPFWAALDMQRLTLVSPSHNFPHRCLMQNCNGDYKPKSSSRLFMFDDPIEFWPTNIV